MSSLEQLHNEALLRYNDGQRSEAIALWRAALAQSPCDCEVLVCLGSALKEDGELEAAAACYSEALAQHPELADVHYNLGNIRQSQGQPGAAAACYQQAVTLRPDFAFAWYNLGNVCRDLGQLQDAVESYKRAIVNAPGHAPSYNNLGNALKHLGELEVARQCYQAALDADPEYREAAYNMGNLCYEQGALEAALPWFRRAGIRDSAARVLYCLYKCGQLTAFREQRDALLAADRHRSPQVAALLAHHAMNFGDSNDYRFCPQPFDFVYQESLPELCGDTPLRSALLADIDAAGIEERTQSRLHQGVQSAGHLFQREEDSFRALAALVRDHFSRYRERFAEADCELIRAFPPALDFESAWYIRMRRGGHLDAHIHEGGWVSGVLYLKLPERGESGQEGCFELGLHGDNYPLEPGVSPPARVVEIREGDIVLFPANLFHRTLPFDSDAERICIAFDLQPAAGVS